MLPLKIFNSRPPSPTLALPAKGRALARQAGICGFGGSSFLIKPFVLKYNCVFLNIIIALQTSPL
jgi:hypothetical protein